MDLIVRVDPKGNISIPSDIRRRLHIEHVARLRVEGDRIVIEPVKDPIEFLESTAIAGISDVEMEIAIIRKSLDKDLCGEG